MAASATRSATRNGGRSPSWKVGLADVIDGEVQAGIGRIGDVAHAAEREGWEVGPA